MDSERLDIAKELNTIKYADFPTMFTKMRSLAAEYGEMPMSSIVNAFGAVKMGMFGNADQNPYVQNRRVKGIGSIPIQFTKNQIAEFLKSPETSERELRQAEKSLEISSYPLHHTRTLYQSLLTYHNHVLPMYADGGLWIR